MEHVKAIYDVLIEQHPDKLTACVRRGDLSPLLPVPLDDETGRGLLQYARKREAEKLKPPHLLSDYLCYVFEGSVTEFAQQQSTTVEQVEQSIFSGCYWNDGELFLLTPLSFSGKPAAAPKDGGVSDFIAKHLEFSKDGRSHVSEMWHRYVLTAGGKSVSRAVFREVLVAELIERGHYKAACVRVGDKVSSGYKGISVKNI